MISEYKYIHTRRLIQALSSPTALTTQGVMGRRMPKEIELAEPAPAPAPNCTEQVIIE